MALSDRPPPIIRWASNLPDDLLKAIGHMAVVSSNVEESLHRIYWKHAGLADQTGPLVTDNLSPKRLSEDILKLVALDPAKELIASDLKVLMAEFETLNTARNHCIHWIWTILEDETPELEGATKLPAAPPSYRILRPVYRRKGESSVDFSITAVEELVNDLCWLEIRLRGHAMDESELRKAREYVEEAGGIVNLGGSFADLALPAPWLNKPPPQDSTPSDRHEKKK